MIGVNVFGLAQKMQEDQFGTLRRLAQIGFNLIEPLLIPLEEQGQHALKQRRMRPSASLEMMLARFDPPNVPEPRGIGLPGADRRRKPWVFKKI